MTKTKVVWIASSVAALALAALLYLSLAKPPNPEAAIEDFVSLQQSGNWGKLYDQAPPNPIASLSRSQFVTLMTELSRQLPPRALEGVSMKVEPMAAFDPERGQFYMRLRFPNVRDEAGNVQERLVRALRTRHGWVIEVENLPVFYARLAGGGDKAKWQRIARAMTVAGVERFATQRRGAIVNRSRVEAFLADQIKVSDIYLR